MAESLLSPRGRLVRIGSKVESSAPPADAKRDRALEGASVVAELLAERHAEIVRRTAELPDVVELARALAERIVGDTLATRDDALHRFAATLLDEARGARQLTLLASPSAIERLRLALANLELGERDLTLLPDPELPEGTLRLATELGDIEAAVGDTLDRLAQAARRHLARS